MIGDGEQGLQTAQDPVGAPVLGQFDGGTGEVPAVFFQLGFKQFEQREGVRRAACEAGQHPILVEAAYLAGIAFHHGIAQRNLAVTANHHAAVPAYRENGCAAKLMFHSYRDSRGLIGR